MGWYSRITCVHILQFPGVLHHVERVCNREDHPSSHAQQHAPPGVDRAAYLILCAVPFLITDKETNLSLLASLRL